MKTRIAGLIALILILLIACLYASAHSAVNQPATEADSWGDPVYGVQLHLAVSKNSSLHGPPEIPAELERLEFQLRNVGSDTVTLDSNRLNWMCDIEVDGTWYSPLGAAGSLNAPRLPALTPGTQSAIFRIFFQVYLVKIGTDGKIVPSEKLDLMPGKHSIRVRPSGGIENSAQPIILVSNEITIDIPDIPAAVGQQAVIRDTTTSRGQSNGNTSPASAPAERGGLQVVIQASKSTFTMDEPFVLTVTYRNVSTEAFRLRNEINPAPYGLWALVMEALGTGTTYTGVTTLPGGSAPHPEQIHPTSLMPGESQATTVTFQRFGFVDGTLDFQAAKEALFKLLGVPPNYSALKPLPPGTYKLSLDIRSFRFSDNPATNDLTQDWFDRIIAGNDPIPLWKDYEIRSNPVEIVIAGR